MALKLGVTAQAPSMKNALAAYVHATNEQHARVRLAQVGFFINNNEKI
jgi:hypothetical protein